MTLPKKLSVVLAAASLALSFAAPAAAYAATPNNLPGGGGGGCTLTVTGSPDVQSYTGHITDTCGYSVRLYLNCVFVFDGMFDRSTKYSSSTTAVTATEKVACDVTDSITGSGWQYNAGHGWING